MSINNSCVNWFRHALPYIHAHRNRIFVISLGGEAMLSDTLPNLVHDIALLYGLGIHLVLVHGARPQIETRLRERNAVLNYVRGLRITDDAALVCVKEAVGMVRVELEALFSYSLANSPMAGMRIRVASGNFVTARPLGIRDGVDYKHTGLVRRVDGEEIKRRLQDGAIVIISPLGYSPTGEVFNLAAQELAAACAIELQADKLIDLLEEPLPLDFDDQFSNVLAPTDVEQILAKSDLSEYLRLHLKYGLSACQHGIKRVHLLQRCLDGVLLQELFTRDGIGILLTAGGYETTRIARIEDIGGILELLQPLEQQSILVRRSREILEMDIEKFILMERDGTVIACAALYPYLMESMAELACFAVHLEYQRGGRGTNLLKYMEQQAIKLQMQQLFVLTTQTAHWFLERGFVETTLDSLPMHKQTLYNYNRNSKVFIKQLQ